MLTLLVGALTPVGSQAANAPVLSVRGETLVWTAAGTRDTYRVAERGEGSRPSAIVVGQEYTPLPLPGATVRYHVKAAHSESDWSNTVTISYGGGGGGGGGGGPGPEEPPLQLEEPEVAATPTGPPTPSGGWHVAFADGFGAPIGPGPRHDNFWYPNRFNPSGGYQPGFNPDELEVFNPSQVNVGREGLELTATYSPNVGGTGANYVSGAVMTANTETEPKFRWTPGGGVTWAFEFVAKMPINTGEVDPGLWSSDYHWTDELDMPELWGWNTHEFGSVYNGGVAWIAKGSGGGMVGFEHDFGVDFPPAAAFHRYTTVIYPNNTYSMYIDGVLQTWVGGGTGVSPPANPNDVPMGLILSLALRKFGLNFLIGSRVLTVRSAAVYQDAAHAGVGVIEGGVAPGTVLGP